jgi:high-affinity nickel-transport protein
VVRVKRVTETEGVGEEREAWEWRIMATMAHIMSVLTGLGILGRLLGRVSAAVLILLGARNAWILVKLVQRMRVMLKDEASGDREGVKEDTVAGLDLEEGGIRVLRVLKVLRVLRALR